MPWTAAERVLRQLPAWDRRILIDATNPIKAFNPPTVEVFDFGIR